MEEKTEARLAAELTRKAVEAREAEEEQAGRAQADAV